MTPAAVEALAFVEWAGPSTYVTARGKSKDILTGTPSPMFWRRWKQCGREIRQGYVSLRQPNAGENWLECQARALWQAAELVRRAYHKAARSEGGAL